MNDFAIVPMHPHDWAAVQTIYAEGLTTGLATFETQVPTWEAWDKSRRPDCRLVAKLEQQIIGWAALSPVSTRQVYAGVAEVSIYLAEASRGQGFGRRLLRTLAEASEQAGVWMLQGSIFPENQPSIALHVACGFRIVGTREKISRLHGVWRDVTLMERRSRVVGWPGDA